MTCWQLMHSKVHISSRTTLPRRSASRRGWSVFNQTVLVSSGAGPRSGSRAEGVGLLTGRVAEAFGWRAAPPHPASPIANKLKSQNSFIQGLLNETIVTNEPYERLTKC